MRTCAKKIVAGTPVTATISGAGFVRGLGWNFHLKASSILAGEGGMSTSDAALFFAGSW